MPSIAAEILSAQPFRISDPSSSNEVDLKYIKSRSVQLEEGLLVP